MEFLNHLLTELQLIWQSISVTHRVLLYAVLEVGSILFLLGQRRPPGMPSPPPATNSFSKSSC